MARYIDIEGAGIGKANREQFLVPEFADGWNAVLKMLEKEPTADVVEVKRGEWMQTKEPLGYRDVDCVECSACHDSWVLDEEFDFETVNDFWSFCPNCGAKMERRTEDE